jgi:hypothetical protein
MFAGKASQLELQLSCIGPPTPTSPLLFVIRWPLALLHLRYKDLLVKLAARIPQLQLQLSEIAIRPHQVTAGSSRVVAPEI